MRDDKKLYVFYAEDENLIKTWLSETCVDFEFVIQSCTVEQISDEEWRRLKSV